MNKKVMIVLSLIMSLCMFATVFASTSFRDVKGTKYEVAVKELSDLGVINGVENGIFKPDGKVTRAQLSKMLVLAYDLKGSGNVKFSDYDEKNWAADYIKTAVKNNVVAGYGDNTFRPENNVTYAEAITMLLRAAKLETKEMKTGKWPDAYISKAEEMNIFENVSNHSNSSKATRGDVALMIYNLMNYEELPFEEVSGEDLDIKLDESKIKNLGLGDINVDGAIDKKDVLLLQSYLNGKEELSKEGLANADLNDDLKINEKDLDILKRYIAGTISMLPYTKENGEVPIPLYPDPVKEEIENIKKDELDVVKDKDELDVVKDKEEKADIKKDELDVVKDEKDVKKDTTKEFTETVEPDVKTIGDNEEKSIKNESTDKKDNTIIKKEEKNSKTDTKGTIDSGSVIGTVIGGTTKIDKKPLPDAELPVQPKPKLELK